MLCQECSKRSICSSLCPEAELYVSQDEVRQRELPVGLPHYSAGRMPTPRKVKLSKRERQIVTLQIDGKTNQEMSQSLNITLKNIHNIVSRIKRKRP